MNGLTAADYADTGQWRLIVRIYLSGMSAFIENTIHTDLEPQLLFSSEWECEPDDLLNHIENAVYDHPRVLDDFSARIIVFDPHTLFMPVSFNENGEGEDEDFYVAVYGGEPADVMTDSFEGILAAYSPVGGLKGFLSRTFPGARIECNLMEQLRRRRNGEGKRIFLTPRKNETDYLLFDGKEFLSGSTHPTPAASDVAYHAANILDVYDMPLDETTVIICGGEAPAEVAEIFQQLKFNFIEEK